MRIRLFCLVLAILLVPTLAGADDHWADLYAAASGGGGGSKLFGFHEAVAKGYPVDPAKPRKLSKLSFVLSDLSVHFGSHDNGTDVTQVTFLFGGRYTFAKPHHKAKFSAHGLLGGVNTNDGGDKNTDFAGAVGFGVEYLPTPKDPRLGKGLGIRAQVDRVFREGERGDFWRISGGIFYRIGQHKD
jgi:hypothetical protein